MKSLWQMQAPSIIGFSGGMFTALSVGMPPQEIYLNLAYTALGAIVSFSATLLCKLCIRKIKERIRKNRDKG